MKRSILCLSLLALTFLLGGWVAQSPSLNFSAGETDARLYGVHEITLTGDDSVSNPFDTLASVTFTAPSGESKTVNMFYDGDSTWRARVYVTEIGAWSWTSTSADDAQLDGQRGAFTAVESQLRGMLKRHPANPRRWITDDGQAFLNLNDTAYLLFNPDQPLWQDYIRDNDAMGITSMRANSLGDFGFNDESSNSPWDGEDLSRYDLDKFHTTDERLQWMLDNYPDMYLQMIIFGQIDWQTEEVGLAWAGVREDIRENTMRYMIARWAAYPQIFWLVVNDMSCTQDEFPNNYAFGREVGQYFAANDPWGHLLSVSPTRDMTFCYLAPADMEWVSYIHLEGSHALGAEVVKHYADYPLHVFLGEDYYEQDHPSRYPHQPDYFYRWLFWSWVLSGGSADYGGRYPLLQPYTESADVPFNFHDQSWGALHGLDSMPYLNAYFADRDIDLGLFESDDALVEDLDERNDDRRPELIYRTGEELIVYHPNALEVERFASPDPDITPGLRLDLRAFPGLFSVEWYRPSDGALETGEAIVGGDYRELLSPWQGQDVVLRLLKSSTDFALLLGAKHP